MTSQGGVQIFFIFFWQIPTSTVISMWEITKKGVQMLKKPSIWLNFVSRAQIVLPEGKFWNFEKKKCIRSYLWPFFSKTPSVIPFRNRQVSGNFVGGDPLHIGEIGGTICTFFETRSKSHLSCSRPYCKIGSGPKSNFLDLNLLGHTWILILYGFQSGKTITDARKTRKREIFGFLEGFWM